MKKKILFAVITFIIVLSLGVIFYFNLFDTSGLVYLNKNEQIKYFDSEWKTLSVVSETGNCYITGERLTNEKNYGIENIRKYNNHPLNQYVQIYDKGDAVSMNINQYGGTIITKTNDVYAFLNGNDSYRTPTYLCSGYTEAVLGDESKIYLLSKNGNFGYVTADKPDDFSLIGQDVTAFNVEYKKSPDSIFVLTKNHNLYILKPNETIQSSQNHIDNILDFDVLVPHGDLCVFSIVDGKRDAYVFMRDYELTYDNFSNINLFQKTGENISSVTSYDSGIAMMYENGDVALFGSDFDESPDDMEFTGDIVLSDVKAVFGGYKNLVLIKSNGEFNYYGKLPDDVRIRITP